MKMYSRNLNLGTYNLNLNTCIRLFTEHHCH